MKIPVMTRQELLRESGLSPAKLRALERRLGLRAPSREPRLYSLTESLRVLRLAKAPRKKA